MSMATLATELMQLHGEGTLFSKSFSQFITHLTSITKILSLSYNDLPYYLKSCFLYFGIFPRDYSVRCGRLIRQWIAEGFVKSKKDKSLEVVAEEYMAELINRNLVQVLQVDFDGKARTCRIHDLLPLGILFLLISRSPGFLGLLFALLVCKPI